MADWDLVDERSLLALAPESGWDDSSVTEEMVAAVRARLENAGGTLTFWAVLAEDSYQTAFDDGLTLQLSAIALNEEDAQRLVELAGEEKWTAWHIRAYSLILRDSLPALVEGWREEDDFSLNHIVELLASIAPGDTASALDAGFDRAGNRRVLKLPGM
ncbi:hypothetical protein FHS83_002800 [Rhizomicrobium palustre]|uniref:Uncharacterized protein n=1 Tax=Rhizomicrobium palustre TaxID=189966 RepID=A0A846N2N0_9PROT|nr:hypothetical protein [Rhizomicrobium palustre]NIK89482.1 hypothetical protein [Rhizomicrobium palustre]